MLISEGFPGVTMGCVDAVFAVDDNVYFIKGEEYVEFSVTTNSALEAQPLTNWAGLPWTTIDAACTSDYWGNVIFAFKDSEYVYFYIDDGTFGEVRDIAAWGTFDSIDACYQNKLWNDRTYMFKDFEYMRYKNSNGNVNGPFDMCQVE